MLDWLMLDWDFDFCWGIGLGAFYDHDRGEFAVVLPFGVLAISRKS